MRFAASLTSFFELGLRYKDLSASLNTCDGYSIEYDLDVPGATSTIAYFRYDNNVGTQLGASENVTQPVAGDDVGLEMVGSALQAWRKPSGGAWATYAGTGRSDGTYTAAGNFLISVYEDTKTAVFDNFSGGTVIEPGTDSTEKLRVLSSPLRW